MVLFSKKQPDLPRRRHAASDQHVAAPEIIDQNHIYRRNRTLTGSLSSHVASANESSAQMKSPRVHAHDLARTRRHLGGILFLVLVGVIGLYGVLSQFAGSVYVHTDDVSIKLDNQYEKAITDYFGTQPTERFRFLLNVDHLTAYLQTITPEVQKVAVDGTGGIGRANITLTMRRPVAGWKVGGAQQYVDSTGTAFKQNYFADPTVQVVDNSGVTVSNGQAIASNRFLGFVGRLVGAAKAKGYNSEQIVIPRGTTRQVELKLVGIVYPLKFSIDRSVGEQVEDMARVLTYLTAHGITPQYVDLRVSNKAFYR